MLLKYNSTPRQIHLQRLLGLLGLPTPGYLHLPVVLNVTGEKLSKQTGAVPVDATNPLPALWRALELLGQSPPRELLAADLESFWRWSMQNWSAAGVPRESGVGFGESSISER